MFSILQLIIAVQKIKKTSELANKVADNKHYSSICGVNIF